MLTCVVINIIIILVNSSGDIARGFGAAAGIIANGSKDNLLTIDNKVLCRLQTTAYFVGFAQHLTLKASHNKLFYDTCLIIYIDI